MTERPHLIENAARAREGRAKKRKRAQASQSDSENDGARVSPRTVKKLRQELADAREHSNVLTDRTNTLTRQRNTQYETVRRIRNASQSALAVQDNEHQAVLADHLRLISELETRLAASEATVDSLRSDLRASEQRLKYHLRERDKYCAREVQKAVKKATTWNLKQSGAYKHSVRALSAELVAYANVGTAHVDTVIRAVAECAGLTVLPRTRGDFRRSVGRFTNEGGMAATLQVAEKLNDANVTGICLSGDGTTSGNLNVMGRHVTVTANGTAETLCLGVTRPVDHTADTTLREWLEEFREIEHVYNICHAASETSESDIFGYNEMWDNIRATASDHAADQVAFADKAQDHRMQVGLTARGIRAIRDMPAAEFQALLHTERWKLVQSVGGVEAWLRLPQQRHQELEREMLSSLQLRLGKLEFDKLSPSEQAFVRFFIRSGCCMHKDLNAVVYGNKSMMASWSAAGLQGPRKLYNRDNTAAANSDSPEARAHAEEATQAGAIKVAFLFGLLFNNPQDKVGYSGLYRVFLEDKYIRCPTIANTQASRFQSNYEMARFMLRYRDDSLHFLHLEQMKKTSRDLNNVEQNVSNALNDGPTLSELAALAFYGTCIGRPYMREVRASGLVNMTELGPLHLRVIEHCAYLSKYPEILFSGPDDDGSVPGTLFGDAYDDPELFEVIAALEKQGLLPHLDVPVRAFFAGAHEGWTRFAHEFVPGGSIASATPEQLATVVIPATNDHNESLVGGWKAAKKRAPSTRVRFFNSKTMLRRNRGIPFFRGLAPTMSKVIRRETRRRDALGLSKLENRRQIEHERAKAARGEALEKRKQDKAVELERRLDAVAPVRFLSLAALLESERTKPILKSVFYENVLWHRKRGQPNVIKKLNKTKPLPTTLEPLRALLIAILQYEVTPGASSTADEPFDYVHLVRARS